MMGEERPLGITLLDYVFVSSWEDARCCMHICGYCPVLAGFCGDVQSDSESVSVAASFQVVAGKQGDGH
jgi:hypothetical protein